MKIQCEIDNIKTLKKGMKITLNIEDEHVKKVMKDIYNFMDKPLEIDLGIDELEQKGRLGQINADQRKKIYALLRDIADYSGDSQDNLKHNLKLKFISESEYEDFSLSNCSYELAKDFIDFLVKFAFEFGVPLKESPKYHME